MQTTSSSSSSASLHQREEKQDFSLIKNIFDDNALTFAEKIISMKNVETHSKKCGSGDIVIVDVDLAMAQRETKAYHNLISRSLTPLLL
jgi:hypothetical protein